MQATRKTSLPVAAVLSALGGMVSGAVSDSESEVSDGVEIEVVFWGCEGVSTAGSRVESWTETNTLVPGRYYMLP